MGQLRNALRAWASDGLTPAEVLSRLSRLLFAFHPEQMATCTYAVLDADDRTLTAASARHYPILLRKPDGSAAELPQAGDPPLGVLEDYQYGERVHQLTAASSLLLYTDGLIERRGTSLDARVRRLADAVEDERQSGDAGDPDRICDRVLASMGAAERETQDDITLLAVGIGLRPARLDHMTTPRQPTRLPSVAAV
jgi:serine phosphatase RsbU (regulator of sigma subunit)